MMSHPHAFVRALKILDMTEQASGYCNMQCEDADEDLGNMFAVYVLEEFYPELDALRNQNDLVKDKKNPSEGDF